MDTAYNTLFIYNVLTTDTPFAPTGATYSVIELQNFTSSGGMSLTYTGTTTKNMKVTIWASGEPGGLPSFATVLYKNGNVVESSRVHVEQNIKQDFNEYIIALEQGDTIDLYGSANSATAVNIGMLAMSIISLTGNPSTQLNAYGGVTIDPAPDPSNDPFSGNPQSFNNGVWTEINPPTATYSIDSMLYFTNPSGMRLQYIGNVTKKFIIQTGFTIHSSEKFILSLYKNGVQMPETLSYFNDTQFGITYIIELEQNDYLALWGNMQASATRNIAYAHMHAIPLDDNYSAGSSEKSYGYLQFMSTSQVLDTGDSTGTLWIGDTSGANYITPTFTASSNFVSATQGRITYNGTTKTFKITCIVAMGTANAGDRTGIFINGVVNAYSQNFNNNTNAVVNTIVTLNNGDIVDARLYGAGGTNDTGIYYYSLLVEAMEVGNTGVLNEYKWSQSDYTNTGSDSRFNDNLTDQTLNLDVRFPLLYVGKESVLTKVVLVAVSANTLTSDVQVHLKKNGSIIDTQIVPTGWGNFDHYDLVYGITYSPGDYVGLSFTSGVIGGQLLLQMFVYGT
jgi:hypothetical protein